MNPQPIHLDPAAVRAAGPGDWTATVHQVHRRPLGLHPVVLLASFGSFAVLAAIVLLAGGSLAPGLILLALGIAFLALSVGGARRDPDAPGAQAVLRLLDRLRSLAWLGAVGARTCLRAGLDLLRLRTRRHRLRRRLNATLAPLGEAVHHDDSSRVHALKQLASELEHELADTDREASHVIAAARDEIELGRAQIEPTQTLSAANDERPPPRRPADT